MQKEEEISSRNVLLRNPEGQDQAEDLISLSELNPPCILHTLQQRYIHNKIYTFTGTILISGMRGREEREASKGEKRTFPL